MKNQALSLAVASVLTGLSYYVALEMGWVTELNWLEVAAVFTSYSCTFLCVVQSRTNYVHGAVSVALYSVLFAQGGLMASAALNVYLVPTLIWGWFRWGRDEETRPVMFVEPIFWPVYLAFTGLVWFALTQMLIALPGFLTWAGYPDAAATVNPTLPWTDTAILVGSVLAQFLLDQKKIETWAVWAVVNVFAIYTYYTAELYLVAFQYVFFLANVFWGAWRWRASMLAVDAARRVRLAMEDAGYDASVPLSPADNNVVPLVRSDA